jgi:uncharacterized protein CbrC (UPF0167 family)
MYSEEPVCYRCGEAGHYRAGCPQATPEPAAASAGATAAPTAYRRTDTVECPTCHRDWVAVFTGPAQFLSTLTCPWCRIFSVDDDGTVRHRSLTTP